MDYLFRLLLGSGAAKSLASTLLFLTPLIVNTPEGVFIQGEIKGAITPKVQRVVATGTPIELVVTASITYQKEQSEKIVFIRHSRILKSDPLTHTVTVDDSLSFSSLAEAIAVYQAYAILIPESIKQEDIREVYFESKIQYPSSLSINIPSKSLWDYYTPTYTWKVKNNANI